MEERREFGFGEAHTVGVAVFGGEVGVEHGGVVGGKCDGDAVAEELRERGRFDRGGGLRELARESAGEDVAAGADFEGDAAGGEEGPEGGSGDGGGTGAGGFCARGGERFAGSFPATAFA